MTSCLSSTQIFAPINMLWNSVILLLFFNCVLSTPLVPSDVNGDVSYYNRFSLWPSVHNGAKLLRVRREGNNAPGPSEGGDVGPKPSNTLPVPQDSHPLPASKAENREELKPANVDNAAAKSSVSSSTQAPSTSAPSIASNSTTASTTIAPVLTNNTNALNTTASEKTTTVDLNNPGVVKRGLIVFGGFALMAVAYFVFYRRKSKNNETGNSHSTIDANQFRYGVLQSEDRQGNELSRVPLTMESDDDEDEDLEIFDLEQKKKSLSYVNLQTNDEDMVFPKEDSPENDRDNLLLDIEDASTDTLINWSSNGNNKSIL